MKKFYLLSLLALSTASMSAAPVEASLKKTDLVEVESNVTLRSAIKAPAQDNNISIKVADYSGETWALLGDGKYADQALAACYGGKTDLMDVVVYEAEGKPGLYAVQGVWADILESDQAVLYIDATDPDFVVVEEQSTGLQDNVDGITYIGSLSAEALSLGINKATFLANYADKNAYVENGVIHFPVNCLGLKWPEAPADSQYGTDATAWYYSYAKTEGLLILPGADYDDPWSEIVEGTMVENIISPLFGMPTPAAYPVGVKKNHDTNTYLIIDPWYGFYSAQGWTGSPNMEIDATDPNNAVIGLSSTGINGGTDGLYYVLSYSYNMEDPAECPEANRVTITEEGENTIITFPVQSMLMYAATSGKLYYASTDVSTITFKTITKEDNSVGDIIVDNDAKVEYFNLQGVRVENPAAGQLVIKRQGSVVTKEIIR